MKKLIMTILCLSVFACLAMSAFAQPSSAQVKKQLTNAKTVSVTLGEAGTVEWSSTYKKYIWTRNFTAKLKTETAGEILVVTGYAAYDVMGGRYVFWRTFTTSNNYEGKKNPTLEELNTAFENGRYQDFVTGDIIGEYESLKIAENPDWEWHTPDSASFTAVGVFNVIYSGDNYGGEPPYVYRQGFRAIDKIQKYFRIRIYRKGAKEPWNRFLVLPLRPTESFRKVKKLLDRRVLPEAEVREMPRMSKMPILTK